MRVDKYLKVALITASALCLGLIYYLLVVQPERANALQQRKDLADANDFCNKNLTAVTTNIQAFEFDQFKLCELNAGNMCTHEDVVKYLCGQGICIDPTSVESRNSYFNKCVTSRIRSVGIAEY